ncbi:hypothetical protein [Clostridium luticellarii]|jgi:uncharacterized membrane protein|uniref:Cytochrome b561 bacterial/Ni-hydrogenase domain-containing protein n=1 Tax=Clostridium luticellarii TaxID=1691940 RepID=A0A2T0BH33_9CLOT|nr:hypothetical protein [Clostridium luticellarii]PRR83221.1 hypothetical protein CLLU_26890 [Clostridium luticellarii]
MGGIAGLLGWITIWGYIIALLNYFMKYVNRTYISKLSNDRKQYKDLYRFVMRYIVKYHKIAEIVASIAVIGHLYLMYSFRGLSISGLVAAAVMLAVFILGVYGIFINRNMRGSWVKIHRILAFTLIVLIGFHVMFSRILLIRK